MKAVFYFFPSQNTMPRQKSQAKKIHNSKCVCLKCSPPSSLLRDSVGESFAEFFKLLEFNYPHLSEKMLIEISKHCKY